LATRIRQPSKFTAVSNFGKRFAEPEAGRPGLATEFQQPVLPLRFGVSGVHNTAGVPSFTDPSSIPHVVYFLEGEEILKEVPHMLPLLLGSVMSPRVAVEIEDREVIVSLDTGAEVSVLPKRLMTELIGDGSRHVRLGEYKTFRPFANPDVKLEGPRCLSTAVRGVKLTHPFYTMDMEIPAVVGVDLLATAKLVIDVMNSCVYSHHHEVEPATSDKDGSTVLCVDNATTFTSYGATATPTVVSTFDHTVLTSEVSDTGGFSSPGVDATLSPFSDAPTRPSLEAPRSRLSPASAPFVPSTASFCDHGAIPHYDHTAHPSTSSVALLIPKTSGRSHPFTQLHPPYVNISFPPPPPEPPPGLGDSTEISGEQTLLKTVISNELPEHVNLLFLQTVEDNTLSPEVTQDLKTLLFDHQHTSAKSSPDLGFCAVLKPRH